MQILLTNDDSYRSQLFQLLFESLEGWGSLLPVVTAHEQSWTSKSITRFGTVDVQPLEICGRHGFSVAGTPADCVNLGAYTLLPTKPDLVVSGINAGINAGRGFLFSSGTVGACLEANIAGIPAIALSQVFSPDVRANYLANGSVSESELDRFRDHQKRVVAQLNSVFFGALHDIFLALPITWNINIPTVIAPNAALTLAPLSNTSYQRLFKKSGEGRYFLEAELPKANQEELSDFSLLSKGIPTITPIDITSLGSLKPEQTPRWAELAQAFQLPG